MPLGRHSTPRSAPSRCFPSRDLAHPGFSAGATLGKANLDGSIPITIRVKNHEIADEARAATGKLLIQSNDAREPHKEVPLFGFGKINKVAPH